MPGWGRSNNEVLPLRTCDLFSLSTLNVTTYPFDSLFIPFNLLGFLHDLICTYHCFQLSIANNSPQDEAQGLIALLGLRRPRLSIPRGSSMSEVDGGGSTSYRSHAPCLSLVWLWLRHHRVNSLVATAHFVFLHWYCRSKYLDYQVLPILVKGPSIAYGDIQTFTCQMQWISHPKHHTPLFCS